MRAVCLKTWGKLWGQKTWGQTERSGLEKYFRRNLKTLAKPTDVLHGQAALLAQHLGHNAGSAKDIEQIFLLKLIRLHELPQDFDWTRRLE